MRLQLLLILLLCASPAAAFTISPAKITFDTPGVHEFTVTVRGTENGTVRIRAEGDLAANISFETQEQPLNGEVVFRGTVTIPEDIIPGDHGQELIVNLESQDTGTLNARIELATLLTARRRFDGPYLIANLYSTPDNGVPNRTTLFFTLENRGNAEVTPTGITIETTNIVRVTPRPIPAGAAVQFSTVLEGQGEYPLTLRVQGANPLEERRTVSIGHPTITLLQARLIPEAGSITPVEVDAAVAWNKPVQAELTIAGKTQPVTIDGGLHGRFYTESTSATIPVILTIGPEMRQVDVQRQVSAPPPSEHTALQVLVALAALVLLGLWVWHRRRRAKLLYNP